MKKHINKIFIILAFIIGLSLILYPAVSNYISSLSFGRDIEKYIDEVSKLNDEEYEKILSSALEYNKMLAAENSSLLYLTDEQREVYNNLLDITGTGIMGYIEIPSVDISLPIYHGTDELVLQMGVGHIEGSSLPVGGESAHSVLSGHRGLPSAKLFTRIDRLENGDTFQIKVLDEIFTYEVDQIQTVEPDALNTLRIEKGQDYCTLVTCTPYGVNTHRLLVRGHRIENPDESETSQNQTQSEKIKDVLTVLLIIIPILLICIIAAVVHYRKRR